MVNKIFIFLSPHHISLVFSIHIFPIIKNRFSQKNKQSNPQPKNPMPPKKLMMKKVAKKMDGEMPVKKVIKSFLSIQDVGKKNSYKFAHLYPKKKKKKFDFPTII